MEKENDLVTEVDAKKEVLEIFKSFLPYVNDEQDRICDLMEVDTQKANAKQCTMIVLKEKMKTALNYKNYEGSQIDCTNLLRMKIELEKL